MILMLVSRLTFLAASTLLCASVLTAEPAKSSAEPVSSSVDEAIGKGIDFLVADQNKNGSWGSPRQTKGLNIYAPAPGSHEAFVTAVTAMAVSALIESGLCEEDGPPKEALQRGEGYLLENLPRVRRATPTAIYNVWTHAYGVRALADMYPRADGETRKKITAVMNQQIDRLGRYESVDGGWGYYDFAIGAAKPASSSISFTSATCLVALHRAREIEGVDVPEKLVQRAIDGINRQRKPDHSYLYGEYLKSRPFYGINRPGGSLARSQSCNYALRLWGDEKITDEVIEEWLVRLGERNGWLDIGRKRPIPHEAWFAVAGYFFYYGHCYAGYCIESLPEEKRPPHQKMLAGILLDLQERDGSWWDFPFYSYHQPYGTSFAVMALSRCR